MKKLASLLALMVLGLSACSSKPPVGITYVDEDEVSDLVEVVSVGKGKTETGTLKAWVTLRNLSDQKLVVEARVRFTGKNGEPIEAAGGWQQVFIEQDSTASFSAFSISDKAVEAEVEVREGNR